ncbi:MAG: DciA family protein, partial [Luteococcus japonicus]
DRNARSGSGPDARDPQPLGAALGRVIEERGWQREVNLRHLLDRWDSLVGPANGAHSHPEAYKDTVLTVRCDATVWATQLRMLAPSLVAQLNRQLGQGTVTRINVLGPTAPSWKHGSRSVRDGRGPRDTYG